MTGLLPVPPGSDPVDALLAPTRTVIDEDGAAHGLLDLDALPRGTTHGVLDVADAPQGARTVANKIADGWTWRLLDGEGWAVRQGKGPPRGSGTRPKLVILEPCQSVTLRAVAVDEWFPDVTHHVVLGWVFVERTGKWKADLACVWTTEPVPGASGRRWWAIPPTPVGVTVAKRLLSGPPDAAEVLAARDAVLRARAEETGPAVDRATDEREVSHDG